MASKAVRAWYSRIGRKGGRARADKLSPARRKEIAKIASDAALKKTLDRQGERDDTVGVEGSKGE